VEVQVLSSALTTEVRLGWTPSHVDLAAAGGIEAPFEVVMVARSAAGLRMG
jgi:hypothetical protein